MIETTIAFIALIVLIGIATAKLWNLVSGLEFYPKQIIIIGLIAAIFLWGIYLTASLSALNQTTFIDTGSGSPIEVTNGDYQTLFNFFPIANVLLLCIGAMTAIEGLKYIIDVVNPKQFRQQYGLQK
jgi:hypothetical protein